MQKNHLQHLTSFHQPSRISTANFIAPVHQNPRTPARRFIAPVKQKHPGQGRDSPFHCIIAAESNPAPYVIASIQQSLTKVSHFVLRCVLTTALPRDMCVHRLVSCSRAQLRDLSVTDCRIGGGDVLETEESPFDARRSSRWS